MFVGLSSAGGFLVKFPGVSGVLVRRVILVKIPGNCAVFVFFRDFELCFWLFAGFILIRIV